ncbi:MAG: hypothetical protein ABIG31_02075 [Candidatus Omnitrophota bacterium]
MGEKKEIALRILGIAFNALFILFCLSATQLTANDSLLEKVFVKEISFDFDLDFKDRKTYVFIYNNIIKSSDFEAFKEMDTSDYSIASWGPFKNRIIELSKTMGVGESDKLRKCLERISKSEYDLPIGAYLIKTKTQKLWMIFGMARYYNENKYTRLKYWVYDAETQRLIDLVRQGP